MVNTIRTAWTWAGVTIYDREVEDECEDLQNVARLRLDAVPQPVQAEAEAPERGPAGQHGEAHHLVVGGEVQVQEGLLPVENPLVCKAEAQERGPHHPGRKTSYSCPRNYFSNNNWRDVKIPWIPGMWAHPHDFTQHDHKKARSPPQDDDHHGDGECSGDQAADHGARVPPQQHRQQQVHRGQRQPCHCKGFNINNASALLNNTTHCRSSWCPSTMTILRPSGPEPNLFIHFLTLSYKWLV